MPTKDSILIGQMLIEEGLIISEQLDAGLKEQKRTGNFICVVGIKSIRGQGIRKNKNAQGY